MNTHAAAHHPFPLHRTHQQHTGTCQRNAPHHPWGVYSLLLCSVRGDVVCTARTMAFCMPSSPLFRRPGSPPLSLPTDASSSSPPSSAPNGIESARPAPDAPTSFSFGVPPADAAAALGASLSRTRESILLEKLSKLEAEVQNDLNLAAQVEALEEKCAKLEETVARLYRELAEVYAERRVTSDGKKRKCDQ